MKLLIVGGVAGGATAAARARRLSESAEITVLERGPYVSYANCGLPYFVSRDIERRSKLLLQTPEGFESRYGVKVLVDTEALEIDRAGRRVRARGPEGEAWLPYDRLILAQGGLADDARPSRASMRRTCSGSGPCPTWTGSTPIIENAKPATAVMAGGGFIGLEMAEAFPQRGMQTTVVELLPRRHVAMDREFGGRSPRELEANGVQRRHGDGRESGHARTREVELTDGRRVPAELVLFSVGVRPELDLARRAGLAVGPAGGLAVDERCGTSDPHIWAAGDMDEIVQKVSGRPVRIPLAGPANRQGRIAATNALGGSMRYGGALGTSVVKIFEATAAVDRPHREGGTRGGFRRRLGDRGQGSPRRLLPRREGAGAEARLRAQGRAAARRAGLRPGRGGEAHRRRGGRAAGSDHGPRPRRGGSRLRAAVRLGERSGQPGGLRRARTTFRAQPARHRRRALARLSAGPEGRPPRGARRAESGRVRGRPPRRGPARPRGRAAFPAGRGAAGPADRGALSVGLPFAPRGEDIEGERLERRAEPHRGVGGATALGGFAVE